MSKFERTPVHDIMVWGGLHGKKRTVRGRLGRHPRGEGGPGVPLVKSLQKTPIRTENGSVEAGIANPEAVRRGKRYIDINLQRCMLEPERHKNTYEGQLREPVLQRSQKRDLLIDMHQQPTRTDIDYMYVGSRVHPYILGVASLAGISTLGVTEGALHAQFPEGVAVDLSKKSARDDVEYWRSLLSTTLQEGLPSPPVEEFTIYAHGDLTDNERHQLGITNRSFSYFEEIEGAGELLGVNRKVYALYPKGIEIVAQLETHEVSTEDGFLRLPSLRSLSR